MSRPVYPYELGDPDFSWLLSTFQENNPNFVLLEAGCLPLVLLPIRVALQPGQPVPLPFNPVEDLLDEETADKV